MTNVVGTHNWFVRGVAAQKGSALATKDNDFGQRASTRFLNPKQHDYRLKPPIRKGLPPKAIIIPPCPGASGKLESPLAWEYKHPSDSKKTQGEHKTRAGRLRIDEYTKITGLFTLLSLPDRDECRKLFKFRNPKSQLA